MPDLLQEVNRVRLMEMAGCDQLRCGLTVMRPRKEMVQIPPTLEHHRRSAATGKATTVSAVRVIDAMDSDDDLAAWIMEQHGE